MADRAGRREQERAGGVRPGVTEEVAGLLFRSDEATGPSRLEVAGELHVEVTLPALAEDAADSLPVQVARVRARERDAAARAAERDVGRLFDLDAGRVVDGTLAAVLRAVVLLSGVAAGACCAGEVPREVAQAVAASGARVDVGHDCSTVGAHSPRAVDVPAHEVVVEGVEVDARAGVRAEQVRVDDGDGDVCERAARLTRVDDGGRHVRRKRRRRSVDGERRDRDARDGRAVAVAQVRARGNGHLQAGHARIARDGVLPRHDLNFVLRVNRRQVEAVRDDVGLTGDDVGRFKDDGVGAVGGRSRAPVNHERSRLPGGHAGEDEGACGVRSRRAPVERDGRAHDRRVLGREHAARERRLAARQHVERRRGGARQIATVGLGHSRYRERVRAGRESRAARRDAER